MNREQAFSQLLKVAARLARGDDLLSDYVEDYGQKTFTASKVAFLMRGPRQAQKDMAVQIRQTADALMKIRVGK